MQQPTVSQIPSQYATGGDNETLAAFSKIGQKSKLEIVSMDSEFAVTFAIWQEDHTLGNLLRHMLSLNKHVEFCGYTMPHPSMDKFHIRIQTDETIRAIDALSEGLMLVRQAAEFARDKFQEETDKFISK